jgi:hypothetical protein
MCRQFRLILCDSQSTPRDRRSRVLPHVTKQLGKSIEVVTARPRRLRLVDSRAVVHLSTSVRNIADFAEPLR